MMRKLLLSILLSIFAIACTTAQNLESCTTVPVSHWTFGLKAGANDFNGIPSPATLSNRVHFIYGGSVEYTINPLAGIGVDLLKNFYNAKRNATNTLDASIFDVSPYFSVNLSNLFFPYRDKFWKKTAFFYEIGVGYGFYHFSWNNDPVTRDYTMLAKQRVNAEYTINKDFALVLEGQFIYYDRPYLAGVSNGRGFAQALTASVGLRFKLGANLKPHARNIRICDYYQKPFPKVDTTAVELYHDALKRLKTAQDQQLDLQENLLILEKRINDFATKK